MGDEPGWSDVIRAEAACAGATARMLWARQLRFPRRLVGSRLPFTDGSTSVVFRETAAGAGSGQPSLLVVEFRLRALGSNPYLHALFRAESWLNTFLFAGFPGFHRKLWLATPGNGAYRGVYDWDGPDDAVRYAERLVRVLRLFSVPGTVRYHVVPGVRLDAFLREPGSVASAAPWWSLAGPISVPHAAPGRPPP
jgi:hypothetical protein